MPTTITTVTKKPAKRQPSLSEQARKLALLECLAQPTEIIDRSRPLSSAVERNLETTINTLAQMLLLEELDKTW